MGCYNTLIGVIVINAFLDSEDKGSTIIRNVGNCLPIDTTYLPRRFVSIVWVMWRSQDIQDMLYKRNTSFTIQLRILSYPQVKSGSSQAAGKPKPDIETTWSSNITRKCWSIAPAGSNSDEEEEKKKKKGGRPYKYHLLPEVDKATVMEPISMADYGSRGSHGWSQTLLSNLTVQRLNYFSVCPQSENPLIVIYL